MPCDTDRRLFDDQNVSDGDTLVYFTVNITFHIIDFDNRLLVCAPKNWLTQINDDDDDDDDEQCMENQINSALVWRSQKA